LPTEARDTFSDVELLAFLAVIEARYTFNLIYCLRIVNITFDTSIAIILSSSFAGHTVI
jgi:hypothetical protein